MRKTQTLIILFTAVPMLLSACGNPTPGVMMDKPTEDMMMHETAAPDAMLDKPTDDMMMHDTATPDGMMHDATATPEAMLDTPDWFGAALTDAHTGQAFTINDFKGKVVLVETMAVWCTNCRAQQAEIKALHDKLGMQADLVILSLDIDPNENENDLKAHAEKYGFDWLYAVAPAQVASEIGNLYTAQFLNPPSTPMLIVDRHGVAHPLPFGIKSTADLEKAIQMYLSEGL